jgi:FGGY-family pentulose kinase
MTATSDSYVLGLDGGTEGMRVGLFTLDGVPVTFARQGYSTTHPRSGWAEQNPAEWWSAIVTGVRQVLADSGVSPDAILGLSVAGTSYTLVSSDANGVPLRPAILWMDVRAHAETQTIATSGDPALKYSGFRHASAEWMPSKALWLKRNEPDTFDRTAWICDAAEWMGFKLTGEKTTSINSAAIRCYYDRLAGGWPLSLYDAIGLPDLAAKMAPRVLDMGEPIGPLSAAAASELGLNPGTLVAQGGADAFVGQIGLGVVAPGSMALITGSSHLHLLQSNEPQYTDGLFGAYTDAVMPGQFTVEGGQSSTGSVINWFKRLHGGTGAAMWNANGDDSTLLQYLSAGAEKIRPGSEGLMALDYWQGNRTPWVDADARGMFWGLSLHHSPFHMFRALIESVCFGTENVMRTMRAEGHPIGDVVACGGALNSAMWMQIHADVSGMAIRTTEVPEAVTLGSAILAAAGAGLHASVTDAANAMVRTNSVVEPRAEMTEQYSFYMEMYRESFTAMRPLMHDMAAHENNLWEAERST